MHANKPNKDIHDQLKCDSPYEQIVEAELKTWKTSGATFTRKICKSDLCQKLSTFKMAADHLLVFFLPHGTLSQLERIKGKRGRELSLIECVTLTHVYKRKAF